MQSVKKAKVLNYTYNGSSLKNQVNKERFIAGTSEIK